MILTVNINNNLSDISRKSMQNAAMRWGCDFLEITENPTEYNPAYVKLLAFDYIPRRADRVLLIDSDTIISRICPNPFVLFKNNLVTVRAAQKRLINYAGIVEHIQREEKLFNVKLEPYFNSGVMLISQHHRELFSLAQYLYKPEATWHDQTPLNIVFKDQPVIYVNETWNFIPQESKDITKFIYHFAGYENKEKHIKEFYNLLYPENL